MVKALISRNPTFAMIFISNMMYYEILDVTEVHFLMIFCPQLFYSPTTILPLSAIGTGVELQYSHYLVLCLVFICYVSCICFIITQNNLFNKCFGVSDFLCLQQFRFLLGLCVRNTVWRTDRADGHLKIQVHTCTRYYIEKSSSRAVLTPGCQYCCTL